MLKWKSIRIGLLAVILIPLSGLHRDTAADEPNQPLILAHYMPWFVAKPASEVWGFHWTMNHFDPEKTVGGRREIASYYYPLIGPYDSGDPDVLEYHLLLMKLAGIDGVIVDWYGLTDLYDYAILHGNTQRLINQATRLGMKFAICYEDQTIPALVKAGRLKPKSRVAHAVTEINWLAENWFSLDGYVRLDGHPVLLSFGHSGLTGEEWSTCLIKLKNSVKYFSEHQRRTGAVGAFDWPVPSRGVAATEEFSKASREWPEALPVAFPRFMDIYQKAELHEGYGRIDDNQGATFGRTLNHALTAESRLVQIATWNDWGEGTIIEPSREFGYRDLEVVQELRRKHVDPDFPRSPGDLRVPMQLLNARQGNEEANNQDLLDRVADLIVAGELKQARTELSVIKGE